MLSDQFEKIKKLIVLFTRAVQVNELISAFLTRFQLSILGKQSGYLWQKPAHKLNSVEPFFLRQERRLFSLMKATVVPKRSLTTAGGRKKVF